MNFKNIIPIIFFSCITAAASCQQSNDQVKNIADKLSKKETTVSAVLTDPSLMPLHSLTAFRDIIKQHANAEKLVLNTDKEPGIKITVKGIIKDKKGNLMANNLVYVYQTSTEGWYSDTAPHIQKNEGDRRHARLFGYFKTGSKGEFEFSTIKPNGYPNSELPAHIHIEIFLKNEKLFITELLFDDDPRLVGDIRARSIAEKFLIEKNTGTQSEPVYSYMIQNPYAD